VSDSYAYVAAYWGGLDIVNISVPSSPLVAGSVAIPPFSNDVFVSGDYAVSVGLELAVIDIHDGAAPYVAGSVGLPAWGYGVAVADSHAYVADYDQGMQVVDIADPTAPAVVASLGTPGFAKGIVTAGDYAYIACDSAGLVMVDISDPLAPQLVGVVDTPGDAVALAAAGSYVYLADRSGGMQVIDVSDPLSASVAGSIDTPGYAMAIAISGSIAYVADYFAGVSVVDISDPTSPALVRSMAIADYAIDIAVHGSQAYVLDLGELIFMDLDNPEFPRHVGSLNPGQDIFSGFAATPQYLYVAAMMDLRIIKLCDSPGLEVINLQSPANNQICSAAPTLSWTVDGGSRNVFSIEFALSPTGRRWSTYSDLHLIIADEFCTVPARLWNRIPSGSWVYWRVQGTDLDQLPRTVVNSAETWRFRKE